MGESAVLPAAKKQQELGYVAGLDGLRALGIILVLIHHGLQPVEFAGFLGVDIFFALSGFLITSILVSEVGKRGRIRVVRFYWRRAVRLYPALLVAIVAVLPFGLMLRGMPHLLEVALAASYLTPVTGEFLGWAGLTWLNTWSLGIEEIFYLIWPFTLILLLQRKVPLPWLWTMILGVVLSLGQIALLTTGHDASYFLRTGGMFLGCALALWLAENREARVPGWVGPAGLMLVTASVAVGGVHAARGAAFLAAACGTVAMIAAIVIPQRRGGILSGVLSAKPVVYVGKVSYELYIWHYPVMICAMLAMNSTRMMDVAWFAMPIGILLAIGTHHLLARPSAKWKQRFP